MSNVTFTTQSGMGYLKGQRVRAASASDPANIWMEGPVYSYSGVKLII